MSETVLKAADPTGEGVPGGGEAPVASAGQGMDDADAFIVERIAEAVVRKIDEQDKINLLAEAVLERLRELNGNAPASGNASNPVAAVEITNDDLKEPTA